MWEVVPGAAVGAVVFSHRAPLALAQVRSPFLPGALEVARLLQACMLGSRWRCGHSSILGTARRRHTNDNTRSAVLHSRSSETALSHQRPLPPRGAGAGGRGGGGGAD